MKKIRDIGFIPLVGILIAIWFVGFYVYACYAVIVLKNYSSYHIFQNYFLFTFFLFPFILIINYLIIPFFRKKRFSQKYLLIKTSKYMKLLMNNEDIRHYIDSLNPIERFEMRMNKYNIDNELLYMHMLMFCIYKIIEQNISEVKLYDKTDEYNVYIYKNYLSNEDDTFELYFNKSFIHNNFEYFISDIKTSKYLTLLSPDEAKYQKVFNGYFGYTKLEKSIDYSLIISYKRKIMKLENNRIITTNEYFDKNHFIYSDNEVLALKILSPSLINLLEDIERKINNITFEMIYKNDIIAFKFFAEVFEFNTISYKEMAIRMEKMEINIKNVISIMTKITEKIREVTK